MIGFLNVIVLALLVPVLGVWVLVVALLGLIPAGIASAKGRPVGLWWLYGCWLFPIALIHSVVMKNRMAQQLAAVMAGQGLRGAGDPAASLGPGARLFAKIVLGIVAALALAAFLIARK